MLYYVGMISRLKGNVIDSDTKSVILDVNGVGYKVFANTETISKSNRSKNSPLELFTYLAVRENSMDLYGFTSKETLEFFELLISVSGIGPKSALGILNVAEVGTLRSAISSGETSHLTKVSGIGKKTAEKIVLELRDKIGALESEFDGTNMKGEVDAMEALKSLGYSQSEAREALKKIPKEISSTSDKVKSALKILGK